MTSKFDELTSCMSDVLYHGMSLDSAFYAIVGEMLSSHDANDVIGALLGAIKLTIDLDEAEKSEREKTNTAQNVTRATPKDKPERCPACGSSDFHIQNFESGVNTFQCGVCGMGTTTKDY
jgi:hypothetical protein